MMIQKANTDVFREKPIKQNDVIEVMEHSSENDITNVDSFFTQEIQEVDELHIIKSLLNIDQINRLLFKLFFLGLFSTQISSVIIHPIYGKIT